MALDILRNSVCTVDGFRVSETTDLKLPAIKLKTEKMHFGGTDGELDVDFGIQAMEAGMKLGAVSEIVMAQVGLRPGVYRTFNFDGVTISEANGEVKGVNVRMMAKIREDDPGAWKHGDKAEWDYKLMVRTYKLTFGGKLIYDIDPLNFIRVINGVDQLAEMRRAMQID